MVKLTNVLNASTAALQGYSRGTKSREEADRLKKQSDVNLQIAQNKLKSQPDPAIAKSEAEATAKANTDKMNMMHQQYAKDATNRVLERYSKTEDPKQLEELRTNPLLADAFSNINNFILMNKDIFFLFLFARVLYKTAGDQGKRIIS